MAKELNTSFVLISVASSENLIRERVEKRMMSDPLGVPFSAYLYQKERYEPIEEVDYTIDNSSDLDNLAKEVTLIAEQLPVR